MSENEWKWVHIEHEWTWEHEWTYGHEKLSETEWNWVKLSETEWNWVCSWKLTSGTVLLCLEAVNRVLPPLSSHTKTSVLGWSRHSSCWVVTTFVSALRELPLELLWLRTVDDWLTAGAWGLLGGTYWSGGGSDFLCGGSLTAAHMLLNHAKLSFHS